MTTLATSAGIAPARLAREALTAFAGAGLQPEERPAAIARAVRAAAGDQVDLAAAYGALHRLAAVLDGLGSAADLHAAIVHRADGARETGARLLELHGGAMPPWPVLRVDMDAAGAGMRGAPRLLLRPQKAFGTIRVDALTTLCNVPPAIWEHAVGEDAVMELEFAAWRAKATAGGQDAAIDKDALTRRIAWLCRVSLETVRLLGT
ncbi:hypothetical protein ACERNI_15575 [Camelimonas sp. ID_303_24]